jgi:hypothetical protein
MRLVCTQSKEKERFQNAAINYFTGKTLYRLDYQVLLKGTQQPTDSPVKSRVGEMKIQFEERKSRMEGHRWQLTQPTMFIDPPMNVTGCTGMEFNSNNNIVGNNIAGSNIGNNNIVGNDIMNTIDPHQSNSMMRIGIDRDQYPWDCSTDNFNNGSDNGSDNGSGIIVDRTKYGIDYDVDRNQYRIDYDSIDNNNTDPEYQNNIDYTTINIVDRECTETNEYKSENHDNNNNNISEEASFVHFISTINTNNTVV